MNGAHWHLVLNHVPVVGVMFGAILMAFGLFRRSPDVVKAAWWSLVLCALITIPTYLTGDPAEETIGGLPNISRDLIHVHERAAKIGLIGSLVLGALSLGGLFVTRKRDDKLRAFGWTTFAGAAACSVWMGYVANLGGQIHHPETRADFVAPERPKHERQPGKRAAD